MKNRLEYLKENITMINSQLAEDMGVCEKMVEAMREQNGLNKREYYRLDEKQKETMRKLYPSATWQEIYDAFPELSKPQIKNRAYDLGLKRNV